MAFDKSAVGFYLQMEDQLSPALASAEGNYEKFVKSMEKLNARAYQSASKGLASLGVFLPKGGAATSKPVELTFRSSAVKSIEIAVARGVARALRKTRFEFRPQVTSSKTTGKLNVNKFAKGGVGTGGTKGKDSIAALIQPGELVVPTSLTEKLFEALGNASAPSRNAKGQFTKAGAGIGDVPDGLVQLMAKATELADALGSRKSMLEAGLGTTAEVKEYHKGIKMLAEVTGDLQQETLDLSVDMRQKLAPVIHDTTRRMDEFVESGAEAESVFTHLLKQVIPPAKFVALSSALSKVSSNFSQLSGHVQGAYSSLEEGQFGSFTQELNESNKTLGLSRDRLREFRTEVGDAAATAEIDFQVAGSAIHAMTDAGLRNTEMMLNLLPAVGLAAEGTTAQVDTLAKLSYKLADGYQFSEGGITSFYANVRHASKAMAVDTEELFQQTSQNLEFLGPAFEGRTEEGKQRLLSSMTDLTAALSNNWADTGGQMSGMLARAMGGDIEAVKNTQMLLGEGFGDVATRLESGDVVGIMDAIGAQIQNMSSDGNVQGLTQLKNALGFEGTADAFANIGKNLPGINENLTLLGKQHLGVTQLAEAQEELKQQVKDSTTWGQQQAKAFRTMMEQAELFGVTGGDVLGFLGEFNAGTLLSVAYLGKQALSIGASTAKMVLGLGPMQKFGGFLGKLGSKGVGGAVGGAAGGAAGGAGGGIFGFLGGGLKALGGGLRVFGAAMLGPGGLGLIALVGSIIGIAFAAKLATPALSVLGKVFMHVIDGVVDITKGLMDLEPRQLLAIGPGLLGVAAGMLALGISVGLMGVGFGLAAVGFLAFSTATSGSRLEDASGGMVGVVGALVAQFDGLQAYEDKLPRVAESLMHVAKFLGLFGLVGVELAALSGGALVADAVSGLLSFFGIDSPMERLSRQGDVMALTVVGLVNSFDSLANMRPSKLKRVASSMGQLGLFIESYERIAKAVEELEDSDILETGWFSDSALQKLYTQGPKVARILSDMYQSIGGSDSVLNVEASQSVTPSVTVAQIANIVAAIDDSAMVQEQGLTNQILSRMLDVLDHGFNGEKAVMGPMMPKRAETRSNTDALAAKIANFGDM